jgi:hypothetical protein
MWFQSSAGEYPIFPALFAEKAIFPTRNILVSFVKNQIVVVAWVCLDLFESGSSFRWS